MTEPIKIWMSAHALAILQGLILISAANGAPVLFARLLGAPFAHPIDGGIVLRDGHPRRDHPRPHPALRNAAAKSPLHRDHPRQAACGSRRPEEGHRDRRSQCFGPATLVETRRVAQTGRVIAPAMNLICGASQSATPDAHTMTVELTKLMRVGHTYRKRGAALRLPMDRDGGLGIRSLADRQAAKATPHSSVTRN